MPKPRAGGAASAQPDQRLTVLKYAICQPCRNTHMHGYVQTNFYPRGMTHLPQIRAVFKTRRFYVAHVA